MLTAMEAIGNVIAAIAQQRRQSLTSIVHRELERMILSGELKAGAKVNEQRLASRLGVSRGPIREARRLLERTGLVTAVTNHGVFVRVFERQEMAENYDMRALVSGFICARAAETAQPAELEELRDTIERMDQAIRQGDTIGYHGGNVSFHDKLADIAGHGRARQFYADLAKEALLQRRIGSALAESNAEHRGLVEAITAGDAERARRQGEAHVMAGKRRWLALTGETRSA